MHNDEEYHIEETKCSDCQVSATSVLMNNNSEIHEDKYVCV